MPSPATAASRMDLSRNCSSPATGRSGSGATWPLTAQTWPARPAAPAFWRRRRSLTRTTWSAWSCPTWLQSRPIWNWCCGAPGYRRKESKRMADFFQAIAYVLQNEGGYSCNPDDPGGETKFGICRRDHPGVDIANLKLDQA